MMPRHLLVHQHRLALVSHTATIRTAGEELELLHTVNVLR
jgi:hypothetical protein